MASVSLILVWCISLILMGCGVLGTVFPALPGSPLIFLGALFVASWQDFTVVGWVPLTLMGTLSLLSVIVDFISSALGARRVAASSWAIIGATVGSLVGIFGGLVGIIIGPFLGALAGELLAQSSLKRAAEVGVATWVGILLGTVVKVALVAAMLGVFVSALFL